MLKRMLFASALISGIAMAWVPDAMAFGVCAQRDAIVGKLKVGLDEVRVDGAAASPSSFYEFFASERTRTWTILLSGVNGVSCVVATGEDWQGTATSVVRRQNDWPRPGALLVQ